MNKPYVRLYVDENGTHNLREDLSNNSNRYLCLTGIAMYLHEHSNLTQELNKIKQKFFNSTDVILHRRELISGKEPFEALKDKDVRKSFDEDFMQVVSNINYRVISVLIDKKVHVEKDGIFNARDPYVIALEYLMQQYLYWLQRFENHVTGDILAESRGGKEDRITKEAYKYVYEGKGFIKLDDTDKYFSSKEIKLKRKKDNIAGLQFVDLLSHPARRYILSYNNRAPDIKSDSYEQRIVNVLVKDKFGRRNNIIEGNGTIFFPK